MCGRYSLAADLEDIQQRFELFDSELTYSLRYNIAATQPVLAVTSEEGKQSAYLRWGLIPSWAKAASVDNRLINARAETVIERPRFRTALARRRYLVLADGFYEWQRVGNARRPMRIVMTSGEPFAFAGLWDSWRDPAGDIIKSCTVITTEANELLRPIHNRMPVILPKELESFWLDDEVQDPFALGDILSPYPAQAMQAYEVSSLVNRPSNEGPEVAIPVGQESPSSGTHQAQLVMFQRGDDETLT